MLNLGIIGAGRIGKVHAESITHHVGGAVVRAIADPLMTDEIKTWAAGLGIGQCYTDYNDILNDEAIDAVLVCSSTDTHASMSIQAIQKGKHVFCEKPVSQSVAEIKQVMQALEGTNLKYQVGFNRRFDHNFAAVRAAVTEGKIGDLHIVKITSRDPEPPPVSYVKVSGGMFLDMTIHDFDMARFLSGSDVVEVYANAASLVDPEIGKAGDVDTAIITMKMANGVLVAIDNSRKAAYGYDQRAEAFGSGGAAAVSNDTASTAIISTGTGVCAEKPLYFFLERYMASFTTEMQSFVDAVVKGGEVPVTVRDGLEATRIGLAAGKSVAEGRPVKLSEIE